MNSVREINVKNDMRNCFDEIINIKNLNPNKIKMDEKIFYLQEASYLKLKTTDVKSLKY